MERLDAPQSTKTLLLLTMLGLLGMLFCHPAAAQGRGGVLRIGMTAADIPYTGGQPDQGFEGFRFIGFQLYDALVRWDLSQGDRLPDLVPGLAESWEVSKDDPTKWIFQPAPWREVPRRHRLQRRCGAVELGQNQDQRSPPV